MKALTARETAKRFLDGAGFIHHVSRRRARLMLSGSLPLDIIAVIALAESIDEPYIDVKSNIEQFIHSGGKQL